MRLKSSRCYKIDAKTTKNTSQQQLAYIRSPNILLRLLYLTVKRMALSMQTFAVILAGKESPEDKEAAV